MKKALLLFVMLLLPLAPCMAEETKVRPERWARPVVSEVLGNWHQVDGRVYRSAQPDAAAMAAVENAGIKRVLNLRQFHDDEDEAEGTQLRLYHVPFNAAAIKDEYVVAALKIIRASDQPILIHCWHGSDRTGTIVAMYRIVEQGWSKQAAIDELRNGGYGYHSIYGNIIEYLEAVDVERVRALLD